MLRVWEEGGSTEGFGYVESCVGCVWGRGDLSDCAKLTGPPRDPATPKPNQTTPGEGGRFT